MKGGGGALQEAFCLTGHGWWLYRPSEIGLLGSPLVLYWANVLVLHCTQYIHNCALNYLALYMLYIIKRLATNVPI